jgi:DNA-binding MarR family transcriptional regulator
MAKKRNFAIIDHKIINDESLSAYDLAVYTVLCRYTNTDTGECYPNQETISEKAGCSISSVSRSIKILKEKGYIDTYMKWKKMYFIVKFIKERKLKNN